VMFDGANGAFPRGGLVQAAGGAIYGTTSAGGAGKAGTIFELEPGNGSLRTLFSFRGTNGAEPYGTLLAGKDGNLYGVTRSGGGRDLGTVYRVSPAGEHRVLVSFAGTNGAHPAAGLVDGGDGFLYGTTTKGGGTGRGTVFRISDAGGFETVASFSGPTGAHPKAALYLAHDGGLYGTTPDGGRHGTGTVYRLDPAAPAAARIRVIAEFDENTSGVSRAPLMQHSGGESFYGSVFGTATGETPEAGNGDNGAIFRMGPDGRVRVLNRMTGPNGGRPLAGLVEGDDGILYGTIRKWGPWKKRLGFGVVFAMTPGGTMSILHVFDGKGGGHPEHAVIQGRDGALYGTVFEGGAHKQGAVFRIRPTMPTG
ncbi:MAG: choice-of-anchor tandem repeat GloVer-containing protein, partial [Nocardioides sp.]